MSLLDSITKSWPPRSVDRDALRATIAKHEARERPDFGPERCAAEVAGRDHRADRLAWEADRAREIYQARMRLEANPPPVLVAFRAWIAIEFDTLRLRPGEFLGVSRAPEVGDDPVSTRVSASETTVVLPPEDARFAAASRLITQARVWARDAWSEDDATIGHTIADLKARVLALREAPVQAPRLLPRQESRQRTMVRA